jgi:hypothetical protein
MRQGVGHLVIATGSIAQNVAQLRPALIVAASVRKMLAASLQISFGLRKTRS